MNGKPIGSCSICGGYVVEAQFRDGKPPVTTCVSCGAVKDTALPVIKMTLVKQVAAKKPDKG